MDLKAQTFRWLSFVLSSMTLLITLSCSSPQNQNQQLPKNEDVWDAEQKLKDLGIVLPEASAPVANYVNAVRTGNLLFLAGKGPGLPDGTFITGKVGQDLTIEEGKEAARMVAINQLAVIKAELGDLNRVKRVVKVLGMVNCGPDFTQQPQVINGFSDLMVEVFGEKGKHARSAVGMNALPMDIAVEVELIVEIEDY
jgi:enamine deaminase RidA (YjgF/YER057c/UK114 family)